MLDVEAPRGILIRYEVDGAARQGTVTRHRDAAVNGNPSGTDDDPTVRCESTEGLRTRPIADRPAGQTDQVTLCDTFGTTKGTPAGASKVSTGRLLRIVQPPASAGGCEVVTRAYDAQAEEICKQDPPGNATETDFDPRAVRSTCA